jgi:hypothetical protein
MKRGQHYFFSNYCPLWDLVLKTVFSTGTLRRSGYKYFRQARLLESWCGLSGLLILNVFRVPHLHFMLIVPSLMMPVNNKALQHVQRRSGRVEVEGFGIK